MFVILADTINWPLIIGIAASAIAVILILFVLLYLFVFQKNKLRRQIRELDRRFEYLHALLIGQDAQYVKRLEIVSRTNLLYVDTHTRFLNCPKRGQINNINCKKGGDSLWLMKN